MALRADEVSELRRLVFRGLQNAADNGYALSEHDAEEAGDLLDTDADVEEFCWADGRFADPHDAVEAVAALVGEWRAGART